VSRRTKQQRARELLASIEHGPSFLSTIGGNGNTLTQKQAEKVYRLWVQTWIVDELRELLRVKPDEPGATS
jgi:hypothetical protein